MWMSIDSICQIYIHYINNIFLNKKSVKIRSVSHTHTLAEWYVGVHEDTHRKKHF